MSEEEQADAIEKLDKEMALDKEALDAKMDIKENAMKRKQAKRNKAMNMMNIIMSTADAVMGAIAAFPVPPFIMAGIVGALGAIQLGIVASTPIPFAQGGLVSGATLGLIGEGAGTSAFNPEVVSPLDRLEKMFGINKVDVHGTIVGEDIVLVSDKADISRERFL